MSEVTKTQVCEKYMEEIDKTMQFLQLMRQHCERQIIEEETRECGICCDGMNDPENICLRRRTMSRQWVNQEELKQLRGMEQSLKNNMFLKGWDGNVDMMNDILSHYDQMRFPDGVFKEQPKQPEDVRVVLVRASDLPPEVQQYFHECHIQYLRNLFGR